MQIRLRRLAVALVVALSVSALGTVSASAGASEEARFVELMNASRRAAGLAPLAVDPDLVPDARRHTAEMIERGDIFHSSSAELAAATSGWTLLGENVGMGPNPDILHQAFMNSASHRANILGAFNYVGVGAARADDGTLFVTVLFAQKPVPAVAPTTTTTPATTTTTLPPSTPVVSPVTTTLPAPAATPPRREPPHRPPAPEPVALFAPFVEGTLCVDVAPLATVCVE